MADLTWTSDDVEPGGKYAPPPGAGWPRVIDIRCTCGGTFVLPSVLADREPIARWPVGDHGVCLLPDDLRQQVIAQLYPPAEEEPRPSNVRALTTEQVSAEGVLRDAMAKVSTERARGAQPQVLVIVVIEDEDAIDFGRTEWRVRDLCLAARMIQVAADALVETGTQGHG